MIKLFSLEGVPHDEEDEIRELLDQNNIDYYETPKGEWVSSLAAIWLYDETHLKKSLDLIKQYQKERLLKARERHIDRVTKPEKKSLMQKVLRKPALRIVLVLVFIIVISLFIFLK